MSEGGGAKFATLLNSEKLSVGFSCQTTVNFATGFNILKKYKFLLLFIRARTHLSTSATFPCLNLLFTRFGFARKLKVLKLRSRKYPSRSREVILQDLARFLQKRVILQDLTRWRLSCKNLERGRLSCKNLERRRLSCKNLAR